jgi:uncharacterized metal-binding protein YceD (DUF177 family)
MLTIDIHQLELGPISIQETLPATWLELDEPTARADQPVEINLTAEKQEEDVLITGSIRTTLSVQCGRCSNWMPWPVHLTEFAQSLEIPSSYVIDLTPVVREDIILTLPVVASCTLGVDFRCPRNGQSYPPAPKETPLVAGSDLWQELNKLKLKE